MLSHQALPIALRHHQEGRLAEAEQLYRAVLAADPRQADAHHLLGLLLLERGEAAGSAECFARAIALSARVGVYHKNLGKAQHALGRPAETVESSRRAVALEPDLAEAHFYLGHALLELGQPLEAMAPLRRALELDPDYPNAHNSLGAVHSKLHQFAEAEACFRRALALRPDFPKASSNLGIALLNQNRPEEAAALLAPVVEAHPEFADAFANLGLTRAGQGRLEEAIACFRRAVALEPDSPEARRSLAVTLLLHGSYEEGWKEYEARPLVCPPAAEAKPRWRGESLAGKTLLLLAEQGFGDTIHFVRFARLTGAQKVILECQPELARLLAASLPDIETLPRGEPYPDFDFHLHLLSLPLTLGKLEPWSPPEPYLRADPALRAAWRARLGPRNRPRIGLAWRGSRDHALDRWRSIPPEQFQPLLALPRLELHSLQPGEPTPPGLLDHTSHLTDFAETAAYLAELDLILTVDTSLAHLAGALGRPTWTLLSFLPDWRWGAAGESTPWYPAMRLLRQPKFGDWGAALRRVADFLLERTKG